MMFNIPTDKLNGAVDTASVMGLLITPEQLNNAVADRFYHCGTITHPRSKNGRFIVKHDMATNFITMVFWNHETSQQDKYHINLTTDHPRKPLSQAERQALQARIDAKIAADRKKQEQERERKAAYYVAEYQKLPHAQEHHYFTRKGLGILDSFNLRVDNRFNRNLLCVPFMNSGGAMQGYQTITADGTKRFNGSVGGCFWQYPAANPCPDVFDTGNSFYLIGEGLATVLSAWNAIINHYDAQVFLPYALVAFNCGNLDKVIKATAAKKLPYLLLVDNDSSKPNNAGIENAKRLIMDNPDAVIYPVLFTNGQDANDYILANGEWAFIELLIKQSPISKLIGH